MILLLHLNCKIYKKIMKKVCLSILTMFVIYCQYAEEPKEGIRSVAEFEKAYKAKVYPFDKISDTTFLRLKNGISFDNEGRFRGFLFIGGLRKELTFEEYIKFKEIISGTTEVYTEEDKLEYERRRGVK